MAKAKQKPKPQEKKEDVKNPPVSLDEAIGKAMGSSSCDSDFENHPKFAKFKSQGDVKP